MRAIFAIVAFLLSASTSFGVYKVGDSVADQCWKNEKEEMVCLKDFENQVRVLIFNTGWCPDCDREMALLAPRSKEFAGLPVAFLSLSSEGFTKGVSATVEFLKQWRKKHAIPFTVALSPRDPGKSFFDPPIYIPNVVVIDREGTLAYKEFEPDLDQLFTAIRKLV